MTRRAAGLLVVAVATGCGRYADFTLPPSPGGDASLTFALEPKPEPVMKHGLMTDVLNPSLIRTAGAYLNLYSGFDGRTWHTLLAESADGIAWQERGIVLSPDSKTWERAYIAANGSALFEGGRFWYWYQAGERGKPAIGLARSGDGRTWRKDAAPVLLSGPYGSWDEFGVADPYVIRAGAYLYLYYLGQDRARPTRQRIGVARSSDGVRWEKLRTNPVLELDDEAGLGEPAVWLSHGFYWMLFTVRNFDETRRLRLARSTDGVHWKKLPAEFSGAEAWNNKVICDASILVEGGTIRVWFGGGDRASPDENLHGQIGTGVLRPVH